MKRPVFLLIAALWSVSPCFAGGIPVADPASLMQMVKNASEQAKQAMDQLKATKDQLMQAKSQFEAMKSATQGNARLGDVFNDPTLTSYLPKSAWKDVYSMSQGYLSTLRQTYGLKSNDTRQQQEFDELLSRANTLEKAYASSVQRQKNIEDMAVNLNSTQTQQQREDLLNRLQYEHIQLKNEQMRLDTIQKLMDVQEKANQKQAAQEFGRKLREMK